MCDTLKLRLIPQFFIFHDPRINITCLALCLAAFAVEDRKQQQHIVVAVCVVPCCPVDNPPPATQGQYQEKGLSNQHPSFRIGKDCHPNYMPHGRGKEARST